MELQQPLWEQENSIDLSHGTSASNQILLDFYYMQKMNMFQTMDMLTSVCLMFCY